MRNYAIKGNTKHVDDVIVTICKDKDTAEKVLKRLKEHPTEHDKEMLKEFKTDSLSIKYVEDEDCWWNDPALCD